MGCLASTRAGPNAVYCQLAHVIRTENSAIMTTQLTSNLFVPEEQDLYIFINFPRIVDGQD